MRPKQLDYSYHVLATLNVPFSRHYLRDPLWFIWRSKVRDLRSEASARHRETRAISTEARTAWMRALAYVLVLCVSMHVLSRSKPVFQSLAARPSPTFSSSSVGGMLAHSFVPPSRVDTAPRSNDPARKQTRWSCFGSRRHELCTRNGVVSIVI